KAEGLMRPGCDVEIGGCEQLGKSYPVALVGQETNGRVAERGSCYICTKRSVPDHPKLDVARGRQAVESVDEHEHVLFAGQAAGIDEHQRFWRCAVQDA